MMQLVLMHMMMVMDRATPTRALKPELSLDPVTYSTTKFVSRLDIESSVALFAIIPCKHSECGGSKCCIYISMDLRSFHSTVD